MIIFRFCALLFSLVDYKPNTFVEHGYGITIECGGHSVKVSGVLAS